MEFAPYQKIPKPNPKSKKDPKCGTVESDPDFLAFVESLEKPDLSSILNPETYLEELENREREAKGWSCLFGFSFKHVMSFYCVVESTVLSIKAQRLGKEFLNKLSV